MCMYMYVCIENSEKYTVQCIMRERNKNGSKKRKRERERGAGRVRGLFLGNKCQQSRCS